MNKSRREHLKEAMRLIDNAIGLIESASESEQDSLDNLPENLQFSDRADKMESAIDAMDSAVEHLESAKEHMENAKNDLRDAVL